MVVLKPEMVYIRDVYLRDGVFNEIVIARHAQLNRNSLQIEGFKYGSERHSGV